MHTNAATLSMWSPESGQTWGAPDTENHGTISLADFLAANDGPENEDVRAQVLALKPGETTTFGGGASPYCEVTLLCSCGGFTRDASGTCAGEHRYGCERRPCPVCLGVSQGHTCCPPVENSRRLETARDSSACKRAVWCVGQAGHGGLCAPTFRTLALYADDGQVAA
jgi:hypothetical protein